MEEPHSLTNVRRSWLESVLDVVRRLGASPTTRDTLEQIAQAVIEVLGFGAAAINVTTPDGNVRTEAVAGPSELAELLGNESPVQIWLDLMDAAEEWGALRFFAHDREDQAPIELLASWTPSEPGNDEPGAWHPDDALFAPMWKGDGTLIGILSVDQPRSGRRPDLEQRTVLELFAAQAATAIAESISRRAAEARQLDAERRWHLAFERSPIGASLSLPDGRFLQSNEALVRILGYTREQLAELTFADITHPDDIDLDVELFAEVLLGQREGYELEKRYIHADGHVVWGVLHVGVIRDDTGNIEAIVGQLNDVTDRKRAEEQLAHRATHDPLTNLPNRALLEERLAGCLVQGRPSGVLFCDLDRFKTINDSLGHDAGDELLAAAAQRLLSAAPGECTVGRVGGDEFVVLVPDENDPEVLRSLGAHLMAALNQPLTIRGHRHTVSASIGITISGPSHDHPDEVLRQADQALLRAKRQGRARVEIYDPAQDKLATIEDLDLEQSLRNALDEGTGLVPYFQPIVSIADGVPVGYEALVRWQHSDKGMLGPDEFLPLAEQTGLVVPLGWWMIDQACRAAMHPKSLGGWSRWVAVNASGSQLGRGQLVPSIRHALDASGLAPDRLHLEITETALVEASASAVSEVNEVADMGVRIALDDFGTGYSSLTLLRDLPVSTVKIDRSFVAPIAVDRAAMAIVRSVIGLCQELGITTVAEGIETEGQLTTLRALGCSEAQGFLIGRPAPLGAARRLGVPRLRQRRGMAG